MSDRKNTNKYYPPDYDPSKGSLNTQLGQHVLRERASRLKSEGILIIRFELPFNCWCEHCHKHIGKGVRYNAEKKCVGNYFSTKIWEFTMKCHLCSGKLVIRTDPKTAQYIPVSGIRAKDESFSADANETIELLDSDDRKRMERDTLFRVEHTEKDKNGANQTLDRIKDIYAINERMEDDFSQNQLLRQKMRTQKKIAASQLKEGHARGLPFALLPASAASNDTPEIDESSNMQKRKLLDQQQRKEEQQLRKKAKRAEPLINFSASSSSASPSSMPSLGVLPLMPLMPVSIARKSSDKEAVPTNTTSAASSAVSTSAASTTSAKVNDVGLLGLGAYDSDSD